LIKSFKHKGLEKFFLTGSKAGIQPAHAKRLRQQLTALTRAVDPDAMDFPGWFLHPLKGHLAGHWSVRVNGSWRLTFRFADDGVEIVDYQDYH
jgi:proteic killer suppression protein